ncbi:MAG: glutathione S-transferase family protein [Proteobacteria bacterium]|nr:glutathione S-transferase family protein [Pseudomonadota bacterium]
MTITVYGFGMSGNCWKVATILRLTGRAFSWIETDSNAGQTRTPEFLALNPNAKVPAVVLEDGTVITESGAILLHFAESTPWLPAPGLARTRVLEWLFFEQYSHEPAIAVARNIITYLKQKPAQAERLRQCWERGAQALDVMERRLAAHDFLTDAGPTVADVALVAYTQAADEGEFDLARWPGVRAWVARVLALPGFTPLPKPA